MGDTRLGQEGGDTLKRETYECNSPSAPRKGSLGRKSSTFKLTITAYVNNNSYPIFKISDNYCNFLFLIQWWDTLRMIKYILRIIFCFYSLQSSKVCCPVSGSEVLNVFIWNVYIRTNCIRF